MKHQYNYKGFFLIELMVSLAIISLFIIVINNFISNLHKLKIESNQNIQNYIQNENRVSFFEYKRDFIDKAKIFQENISFNGNKIDILKYEYIEPNKLIFLDSGIRI